ncbi:MAG: hypothetical protein H7069_05635 [Phormidesmis sp. FL-bin-119]|nr:hypothetical protein [Pedobacter sp.]
MEHKNSQELDKKIFSDLIHDPSAIIASDSEVLAGLIEKYPYSQLLRSFYTRSLVHSPSGTFEKELVKTALFSNNRVILQTIIEDPQSLQGRPHGSRLTSQINAETPEAILIGEESLEAGARMNEADFFSEPEVRNGEELIKPEADQDHSMEDAPVNEAIAETVREDLAEGEIGSILAAELETFGDDTLGDNDLQPDEENPKNKSNDLTGNLIDTLISDDISRPVKALTEQNVATPDFSNELEAPDSEVDTTEDVFTPDVDIAKNITHNVVVADHRKISIYDDDKMPYSFLWWLSKTRNEHVDNYQPYVSFKLDTSQSIRRNTVDQLSTQIIENIFHLQSPIDELKNAPKTVPFQVRRKEDFIVEKFIREEPQIKPPNSEKLDNENKARKSAEDPNDLVSETLAHIYTDQMLFYKAIETYKKLSLKFPEKSTYFADQIRELEKKIN